MNKKSIQFIILEHFFYLISTTVLFLRFMREREGIGFFQMRCDKSLYQIQWKVCPKTTLPNTIIHVWVSQHLKKTYALPFSPFHSATKKMILMYSFIMATVT
ncbi:MAG: hypothetical protein A3B74_00365 [Candidatus Kerfeldbacteria bacterium RIFCSPHIGHO2_02_FULL_42_14]|uniref:Uncharacterized protein n=1 Tax=Candidatus Kerfeldbacteria bacterium RIFCSPHIGHO2_02_FULL_42_14 TaxID=1798540 RepID=A0A1G2ATE1_9BACT|nr:MAG: hypothetical protein A3B74_00365 [Candidatus Kerfeldbacteria bacterium RIFCSPHIGHO2_02_FULL_42_14]OGY85791.1 MAG: hypothetical protein A3G01_04030 [Candidatus Kerfeldbacteria bacterium RIFCSPLOWO2_12_FULL_43_9]